MHISSIFELEKYRRAAARGKKKIKWMFKSPKKSIPVFVLGSQRSGTTIFMDVLEANDDTEVFQEWDKRVFAGCRIKNIDIVGEAIKRSRAPFVCFKPICDSHLVEQYVRAYPDLRIIWLCRDYMDVANSSIRLFETPDKAIREIIEGKKTEGWFYEGISPETLRILRSIYLPGMSKFEMACLVWWARNRVFFELDVAQDELFVVKYENLVTDPARTFSDIRKFTGLSVNEDSMSLLHSSSVKKHQYQDIHDSIRMLCDDLMARYVEIINRQAH